MATRGVYENITRDQTRYTYDIRVVEADVATSVFVSMSFTTANERSVAAAFWCRPTHGVNVLNL